MATYLAFFAAGKFETHKGSYRGRPWYVAVSKELRGGQRSGMVRLMKKTPKITLWLERQLGRYPFSTTGGLVTALPVRVRAREPDPADLPGRLTGCHVAGRPRAGAPVVRRLGVGQALERHLAQRGVRDVHGGALRRDARRGQRHHWLRQVYRSRGPADDFWDVKIGDPGKTRIFDGAVYDRGAMTLQALRHRVGEADFWKILHTWVAQRRHGNGSVADFRALSETDQRRGPRRVLHRLARHPGAPGRHGRERALAQPRSRTDRQVTQPSSFSNSEMSTATTRARATRTAPGCAARWWT